MDILVVDDNVELLKYIHGFLAEAGHAVESAVSAEHALEIVEQSKRNFDVVVTDIAMPGMNGIELWNELKEILPEAKVLFISASSGEFMQHYLPGAFLGKPFSLETLHERVLQLTELQQDSYVRNA